DLDLARGNLLVDGVAVALADLPLHGDDGLAAQLRRLVVHFLDPVGAEEDLRLAVAVAQVDEDQLAEVAPHVDPAVQDHGLADVRDAQLTAGVRPLEFPHSSLRPLSNRTIPGLATEDTEDTEQTPLC